MQAETIIRRELSANGMIQIEAIYPNQDGTGWKSVSNDPFLLVTLYGHDLDIIHAWKPQTLKEANDIVEKELAGLFK